MDYTTAEVASLLGVQSQTIRKHIKNGVIKAHQSAKTHLIASEEVERFIVERRKPGQPKKGKQ